MRAEPRGTGRKEEANGEEMSSEVHDRMRKRKAETESSYYFTVVVWFRLTI